MQSKFIMYGLLYTFLKSTVAISSQIHVDCSSATQLTAQQFATKVFQQEPISQEFVAAKLKEIMILYQATSQVKIYGTAYIKLVIKDQETWCHITLPKLLIPKPEQLNNNSVRTSKYLQMTNKTSSYRSSTSQIDRMLLEASRTRLANKSEEL